MEFENKGNSSGVAKAALATAIPAATVSALNAFGGLGSLFGNRSNNCVAATNSVCCESDHLVNRYELSSDMTFMKEMQAKDLQISELKTEVKFRDANTYVDQKMLELHAYYDAKLKDINDQLCQQAVLNQANKDSFQIVQERLDCTRKELCSAINQETKERKCADNTIITYANATFYPKLVAGVTPTTTTTEQAVYNPLPVDVCDCNSCC